MCEKTVLSFCRPLFKPGSKLLVAVSGGSDSTALFHILVRLREELGIAALGVAHVNHGLRGPESDREEEFVKRLAGDFGSPCHVKRLSGLTLDEKGLEERARAERYTFFCSLQKQHGYIFVATGHTADDQAETVLMRLLRGAGLNGLAGIWPVRDDGIMRPLLTLRREELRRWLEERGLTYCEDSSNADRRFMRNWVRHTVLPLLAQREARAVEHLCWCAEAAREYVGELGPRVNAWIADHVTFEGPNSFTLRKWSPQSERSIAAEAVATLFRRKAIPFDRKHIDLFLTECWRTSGQFLLAGGWKFFPRKKKIEVACGDRPAAVPEQFRCALNVPGSTVCREGHCRFEAAIRKRSGISLMYDRANATAYLDAASAGTKLVYRCASDGDLFQPLGAKRPRDLMRFLKSQRVEERRSIGVVETESGHIAWIPRVAVGQNFRVTDATDTIVTISYQPL